MSTEEKRKRKKHNQELYKIIGNYKLYKIRLLEKHKLSEAVISQYEKYLKRVDCCIELLRPSVRTVFENSFLEKNLLYILGFYSESQYYRLKNKGREEFLKSFKRRIEYV